MIKHLLLFAGLLSINWGLVTSNLHETNKLKVTFSIKDTNRIVIDNSRIAQLFGVDNVLDYQFDEINGQCFVKARHNPGHPITLTLVSEEGESQALEVSFGEVPSEVVVLHSLKKDNQVVEKALTGGNDEQRKAVEIIKEILCGRVPKGFEIKSDKGIERYFSNGQWDVIVLSTREDKIIKASSIATPKDIAIYIGESFVIRVQKRCHHASL